LEIFGVDRRKRTVYRIGDDNRRPMHGGQQSRVAPEAGVGQGITGAWWLRSEMLYEVPRQWQKP